MLKKMKKKNIYDIKKLQQIIEKYIWFSMKSSVYLVFNEKFFNILAVLMG